MEHGLRQISSGTCGLMFQRRSRIALLGVALVAAMGLGMVLGRWVPLDDEFFELRKNFRIFGAAYEEVVTGYVEPVDPGHLMRVGLEAMLAELDPYTSYVNEADQAELNVISQGRYGGVGLEVGRRGDEITVVAPVEDASGYRQGVRTGDVIRKIGNQPTDELSLDDVQTLLRGEPGTTVRLTIEREGAPTPLEFTLTREQVDPEDVTYQGFVGSEPSVGYVRLERFTRDASSEVESALRTMKEDARLTGIILDLRDNPGGLLSSAVGVAELFLEQGAVVVSTQGRRPDVENTYRSDRRPVLPDVPLVVLVNDHSASASEIVAGAVQDHDRGVLMGTGTFGKGLVQAVQSLPHNTSLKITTAQYYTPSGRTIHHLNPDARDSSATEAEGQAHETSNGRIVRDGDGIRPDVHVSGTEPSALEQALQGQAAFFLYANHYAATHDTLAEDFSKTGPALDAFRMWLDQEEVHYPIEAERTLDTLRAQFEAAGHDAVDGQVTALEEAVRGAKEEAFDRHGAALERHLEREILARYVSQTRRVEAMLPHDQQVAAAVEMLNDPERYDQILRPEGG